MSACVPAHSAGLPMLVSKAVSRHRLLSAGVITCTLFAGMFYARLLWPAWTEL